MVPLMVTIYMPLLNEGTDVWRPVHARQVSGDRYCIEEESVEYEEWAFAPGSTVICEWKIFNDGSQGLAVVKPVR
jgi:hypothetical protein